MNFAYYEWDNMDVQNPDKARQYLVENMAEGHLSAEEESFINEFISEYKKTRAVADNVEGILGDYEYLKVM